MVKTERYNEPLQPKEIYFSLWKKEELEHITESHKESIYNEYRTRHIVFNRDNFQCQVDGCKYKDSPITMHHFKHRSNGGKTCPRNCITVCRAHQNHYHSGRAALKFIEHERLPNHIAGATQAHEWYVNGKRETENPEWKLKMHRMRQIRKEHREDWGRHLPWEIILLLMNFLFPSG